MWYFKYDDEYSEIAGGVTYIETNDGWAVRQVTLSGEQHQASKLYDPMWGMVLAEGQIAYDDLDADQITEITTEEFEAVWDTVLARHQEVWQRSKARYALGSQVQGELLIFYPQGAVVKLDQETLGIADYDACRASTAPENMYPRHRVTAIVTGYDEIQHWIVLDQPRVHEDEIV